MAKIFALKGDIVFCKTMKEIKYLENSYIICSNNHCLGVFEKIPKQFENIEIKDYSNKIIIPGLIDLHTHASQYEVCGTGMDCSLMKWLEKYIFKTESQFDDINYSDLAYEKFVNDLKATATSRAVIFATIYKESTLLLMDKLEASGLISFVGKINMDRNSPSYYIEETNKSLDDTIEFIERVDCRNYKNTKPIITPRFIPTCSNELMKGLSKIQKINNLPLQSHLSENDKEINFVQDLNPELDFYAQSYDRFNLFGKRVDTIMAHCVLSSEDEIELIKKNGVFIAHCPSSNINLGSGIAPTKKYLEKNINIGLGSDVAAGDSLSLFDEMVSAIKVSKLYNKYIDNNLESLNIEEAFYLATLGGGKFFGKVGSFIEGFEFDAVVIDDSLVRNIKQLSLKNRFEKMIYLSSQCKILAKFVRGKNIL